MNPLRRLLPIGLYEPKHWLDYDKRGAWLIPVCMVVCVLALVVPVVVPVVVAVCCG